MRKTLLRLTLVAAVVAIAATVGTSRAFAYGHADQPLAQLTVSANCDNASFWLCQPDAVGLGGIWAWVEVDAGGTGDMTGAECKHTVGGGGPGSAGAGPIGPTDINWQEINGSEIPPGFFQLGTDPNNEYYMVDQLGPFAFPVTAGHYSLRLATGVQIQATVAP